MWHTPDAQQWKQGLCVDPLCGSHSDVLTLIWSTEQNSSIMTRRVKLISQNAHGTRQNKNVTWVSVKKTPWDWTRGFGARVYAAMDRPKEREKRERRNWGSGCLFVNMWARRCVASWWVVVQEFGTWEIENIISVSRLCVVFLVLGLFWKGTGYTLFNPGCQ